MTPNTVILHYSEIALKTGNRLFFERALARNAERLLLPFGVKGLRLGRGRIFGELSPEADFIGLRRVMPFLFGATSLVLAVRTEPELESIKRTAVECMGANEAKTFKVDTRRSDKQFPKTSMELNALLGEAIINATGKKVDVHTPETVCSVELLEKDAYISSETIAGPGGLPTGSQSSLMVMLSGGIDSPVAALRMQRRGAPVEGIHFFSYPFTNRASLDKVKELAGIIAVAQGTMAVTCIPFAEVQKATVKFAPPELRVILYRRSMFRIAEALAVRSNIKGLVTGESLGQVASQTIENIAAVSEAVRIPIFRPLIGTNKEEIMTEAREYGTFEISIRPHEDCCSLFLPEHPETRAELEKVLAAERAITDLAELEATALAQATSFTYAPAGAHVKQGLVLP